MYELDNVLDLFLDDVKHLFFPESWLQLDLKFSKSELFALLFIAKRHEITMTELSEYINIPMSTANGLIERLLKQGYVSRERSESDRRIVVVQLTEEGSQLVESLKGTIVAYVKVVLADLSEEEIRFLINIATRVVRNLQGKASAEPAVEREEVRRIDIQ